MAIKYNPTADSDATGYVNFLNDNKNGTIFENAEITLLNNVKQMQIKLNNSTITISSQADSNYTKLVTLSSGSGDITWGDFGLNQYYYNGLILSNNGIIFCVYRSSYIHYFAIVVDSNNKLSFIYGTNTLESTKENITVGVSISSINQNPITLTPQYNSTITSLAFITPTTGYNNIYFPNAYVAVATQLSGTGMYIVTINDAVYITNGIWYIPD